MARPFVRALQEKGLDAQPVLQAAGLDPERLSEPDAFIAAQNWYDFAGTAAEVLKDPCLGHDIGSSAAIETLPNLRVLEFPHATLGELLTALVVDVRRFSTIANYTLTTDGRTASLETSRTFTPNKAPAQIDGFFAGFMVRILSMCTGKSWDPALLRIGVCQADAVPADLRSRCNVQETGLTGATFHFPATWLLLRTDGAPGQPVTRGTRPSTSALDSFRVLLDQHLDQQGMTLEVFSNLSGQSPAKLKRLLHSHGTSYHRELDRRRASRAAFYLQATDMTAGEVGHAVGYPDPPSFSRAFKRWTSETPAEYRKARKIR